MHLKTELGVLTDTEILVVETFKQKRALRSFPIPFGEVTSNSLLAFLWETGLSEVWVLPGTEISRVVTQDWLEQARSTWEIIFHTNPNAPDVLLSALLWPNYGKERQRYRLAVVFPERAGWGWRTGDARSLLATVTYLHQTLGRTPVDGPDLTAHQILADRTRDYPLSAYRSSLGDLPVLQGEDSLENRGDMSWMRPLTFGEERQKYLHKYTHFSRSLVACTDVPLGTGAARYSANGGDYDGMSPGLWRVSVERAGSIFDGKRLPTGFEGEWMSTPLVKSCQNIGYRVQVREGYFWSASQPLLKQWATSLWQAGERLSIQTQTYRHAPARANAVSAIQLLANRTLALFAQDKASGGWARPDWWIQIMDRARALLFAHLVNLTKAGIMPVLLDQDAFWVVSNDPNPLTTIPGLINQKQWKGYSVGYRVPLPLSPEIRETLKTAQHARQVATMLEMLADQTSG